MRDKRDVLLQSRQRLDRVHPRRKFNDWFAAVGRFASNLLRCAKQGAKRQRLAWRTLTRAFVAGPSGGAAQTTARGFGGRKCRDCASRLVTTCASGESCRNDGNSAAITWTRTSACARLSITMDAESGKVLREAKTVQKGRKIRTRLKAGKSSARWIMVKSGSPWIISNRERNSVPALWSGQCPIKALRVGS